MELDALLLSRIQFALTIMFHYLFPPLTIGLGVVMVFTEGMFLKTRHPDYEALARFWTGIFAVNFAMGVATGIVMEFQFGTNWAIYSRFVGDVFGSALAAEGIFAFFLESGFLAVLVFGWDRVSPRVHFLSTVLVALGSIFSAVWIVVANSWQQTPAGYHLVERNGLIRAEITDFWAVVFNPSSMIRLSHVLVGAFILGAFVVLSITAYYILRGRHVDMAMKSFKIALVIATVSSLGQLLLGDFHARQVARDQPAKLAAFEGQYKTTGNAPLHIIGWPDDNSQTVRFPVAIPGMLSYLVHRDTNAEIPGLDQLPRDEWPPVFLSFTSFHIMVGLGMFFIGITLLASLFWWRGTLFNQRWLLWVFVFAVLGPYVSNQLGWVATEVGRQPWIVYGLLKTAEAGSPSVPAGQVMASIGIFGLIYLSLFAVFVYVMNDKIHHGPEQFRPGADESAKGFYDTSAEYTDPAGKSFTAVDDEAEDREETR